MNILDHLKIKAKLALVLAISALSLASDPVEAARSLRQIVDAMLAKRGA